jgi:hypothetical protein
MRCPQCNKFVAFDEGNVDDIQAEIDEVSGEVTIEGRIVLPCAECGEELKQLEISSAAETTDLFDPVADVVRAHYLDVYEKTDDWIMERVEVSYDGDFTPHYTERQEEKKNRKGQVIRNPRATTLKGVEVLGTVKRTITSINKCFKLEPITEEREFNETIEEPASAFEELT